MSDDICFMHPDYIGRDCPCDMREKIEERDKNIVATLALLDSMIGNCCGEKTRFCSEYGCASLKTIRDTLKK